MKKPRQQVIEEDDEKKDKSKSVQRASFRGRLPLPTLARKERIEQNNVNKADRGPEAGAS